MKRIRQTTLTVKEDGDLTSFMEKHFAGMSRNSLKQLLRAGQVCVNGKPQTQFNYPLHMGDVVLLNTGKVEYELKDTRVKILYEDNDVIVIDKGEGLLSVSARETKTDVSAFSIIERYMKRKDPNAHLYVVHRLDKATSGVMLFVKKVEVQHAMRDKWKDYVSERTYIAMTEGVPYPFEDTIQSFLHENKRQTMYSTLDGEDDDGKLSTTHYCVVRRTQHHALVKLNLETGRKNQIRVHMHDIDCPIVGDIKYGASSASPINRLGLHALTLVFKHPATGKEMRFTSPLPRVFNAFMEKEQKAEETLQAVKEQSHRRNKLENEAKRQKRNS